MTVQFASVVLDAVALYGAVGVLFAALFLPFGLSRIDRTAAQGPLSFKLLITPGVIALWPVLVVLWAAGGRKEAP